MTDKIDKVIADIMAKRAEDLASADKKQHELEREESRQQIATKAATDLRTRIDRFVTDLNTKLEVADIAVVLRVMPGDKVGSYYPTTLRGSLRHPEGAILRSRPSSRSARTGLPIYSFRPRTMSTLGQRSSSTRRP
jgi:hypothetical protein